MRSCTPDPDAAGETSDDDADPQNTLYTQLLLYALGVCLANGLSAALVCTWGVLSGFRDAMLWALLCSVALRDLKEWLVKFWQQRLSQDRTLVMISIELLRLPLQAITGTAADILGILKRWRQYAQEYEADFRREKAKSLRAAKQAAKDSDEVPPSPVADRPTSSGYMAQEQQRLHRRSTSGSANPDMRRVTSKRVRSRRRLASQTSSSAQALGALSAIAKLGFKALRSTERRAAQRAQQPPAGTAAMRQRDSAHQRAQALFRWLLRACMLYELSSWFVRSWTAALQIMLVSGTLLAALGLLPFLYFVAHWYLMQSSPLEAWNSPPRSLIRRPSSKGDRETLHFSDSNKGSEIQPQQAQDAVPTETQEEVSGPADESVSGMSSDRQLRRRSSFGNNLKQTCSLSKAVLLSSWHWTKSTYYAVDTVLRGGLHDSMHTLVTVGLIVTLLVGTVASGTFVGLQIANEGRTAVLAVTEALPSWSLKPSDQATALSTQGQGHWQVWLREWQGSLMTLAERNVPSIYSWIEVQLDDLVRANNLTSVVQELKVLSVTLQPPKPCTSAERRVLVISRAKAHLHAGKAKARLQRSYQELRRRREAIAAALQAYEESPPVQPANISIGIQAHSAEDIVGDWNRDMEEAIAAADAQEQQAKAALARAAKEDESARQELDTLERLLGRCSGAAGSAVAQVQSTAARRLMQQLQAAYAHIWQLQLREGIAELMAVGRDAVKVAREVTSGRGASAWDLSALQRIAAAASEPLIALGRSAGAVLVSGLGSTTAAALTSGLGILRLGVGMVQTGVQLTLFFALLYYLLAAEADPLLYAVRLLPLSDGGRQQTATALSDALRGVFLCALKLALFHAGFTWLTLRMFRVHFVYATTVAAAATALLPLIPSWLVAVPASLQLILQDRVLAAVMLLGAHFGAWFLADEIILAEIPGSHPYLTGLGIIGGMYTFDNHLQGAIVGPMLLSLLSVFYNLHSQFMGSSKLPPMSSFPGSQRASLSRSTSFDSNFSRFRVPQGAS